MMLTACSLSPACLWSQWLNEVSLSLGFSVNEASALQDLRKFQLVDVDRYDLDERLTGEMIFETCEMMLDEQQMKQYPFLKWNGRTVNDQQMIQAVDWLKKQMNQISDDFHSVIVYDQPVIFVTVLSVDGEWIEIQESVQKDALVQADGTVYRVTDVLDQWIQVEPVSFEDVSDMDLEGSVQLNLEEAKIFTNGKLVEMNQMPGAGLPASRLSKVFDVNGFTVRMSSSSDSIHVYVSKKLENGLPVFVQFDVNEISCDFKWKTKNKQIEASALKVKAETSLTSGLKTSRYFDEQLDFSKVDSSDFLGSLQDAFVKKGECLEESIELAELHLPIPQLPACLIKMKLLLHVYASGKAEIGFESQHEMGFELINGQLRLIQESEKEAHASFRASAKCTTRLQFLFSALSQDCMDVLLDLGVQGVAKTSVHMDDHLVEVDVPYEAMEDLVDDQVCADLNAFWLVQLGLNSSKTVLGSLGFGKTISLVDEDNGSLFGKSVHLENFQIVDHCTRRSFGTSLQSMVSSDRIELKHYLLILEENERALIEISGLPDGIQKSDLIYTSNDFEIASVSSNGTVTAKSSGQTIVEISTKDGRYETQCSIFVR